MPEPIQRKDVSFSREGFFAGGPSQGAEIQVEIRVEDGRFARSLFDPLHRFTNMLVQNVSVIDAERTQYLLSSNNTVKLYVFNRSVTALSMQLVLMDADPKGVEFDDLVSFRQDAFEQFMWLYENELRAPQSIRKQRRVILRFNELDYEVLFTNLAEGFASEGEWQVIANVEMLVLKAEMLNVGPAGLLKQGTDGDAVLATASTELLRDLDALSVDQNRPSGSASGGVAGKIKKSYGPTIDTILEV